MVTEPSGFHRFPYFSIRQHPPVHTPTARNTIGQMKNLFVSLFVALISVSGFGETSWGIRYSGTLYEAMYALRINALQQNPAQVIVVPDYVFPYVAIRAIDLQKQLDREDACSPFNDRSFSKYGCVVTPSWETAMSNYNAHIYARIKNVISLPDGQVLVLWSNY